LIAHNELLDRLLGRLTQAAGIHLHANSSSDRISVKLRDVPIDNALRNLLSDHDTIFVYGREQPDVLVEIYVYGRRGGREASDVTTGAELDFNDLPSHSAAQVERTDALLRTDLGMAAPEVPVPAEILADPEPEVRITGLQWSVGKGEAFVDALAHALVDEDGRVQSAARELLLQQGIDENAVTTVTDVAWSGDLLAVRDLLPPLLKSASGASQTTE
jgi:hypothetical protein